MVSAALAQQVDCAKLEKKRQQQRNSKTKIRGLLTAEQQEEKKKRDTAIASQSIISHFIQLPSPFAAYIHALSPILRN